MVVHLWIARTFSSKQVPEEFALFTELLYVSAESEVSDFAVLAYVD